ncbi:MAG: type II toxin-antitoxin system VapC family toxin [Chloroflexi bacterium]|nr:type II toxin-antitoxin system VapC family toxin [Chloroflexota bacterium]
MTELIAIDSNVLIAFVDGRDKWHSQARVLLAELDTQDREVVFFDCVLNESISVMARRSEERKTTKEFPGLLKRLEQVVPEDTIAWVSEEIRTLYHDILELVKETNGRLNFHDALIALVCREMGIPTVVSFDKDFDEIEWLTRMPKPEA